MVLLVRQPHIPPYLDGDGHAGETCAGMVVPGDRPIETVRKEAEREVGYRLRSVRKVFELYMSPGASAEKLHLFGAEYGPGDRVGTGGVPGEGERIELMELPLVRAWEMVMAGGTNDPKTVLLQQARLDGTAP